MNFTLDTKSICEMYMHAAECARWWRKVGFSILMNGEKEDNENNEEEKKERIRVEEWVELLIVNGALGVDYIGEDDDGDDDDEDIGEDDNEMDSKEKQQVNNDNNGNKKDKDNNMEEHNAKSRNKDSNKYQYSYSEIEANASFMSSLLLSTLGKHDQALQYLEQFQLSHRIHPNVWKEAQSHSQGNNDNNRKEDKSNVSNSDASVAVPFLPRVYRQCKDNATATENNGQGILPPYLYQRLCNLFAPNAPYWNESGYNHRGYYSYFIDLEAKNKRNSTATATAAAAAAAAPSSGVGVKECPTNCIEDVIINHLLPLAERTLKDENDKEDTKNNKHIVGAEWWVHTRPLGANLGHQLHFDTDESLLGKEKKVTHPIVSSILYLTGANPASSSSSTAGSTIVFDQTPNSKEVASQVWIGHAQDNACMHFPGNLLHGVLPCAGGGGEGKGSTTNASKNNRLTFMVGFWTRNVPEGMGDDRQLYGPCGPLPPATPEHSWVIDCQRGYTVHNTGSRASHAIQDRGEQQKGIIQEILPCASPAWEEINTKKKHESNSNTCNQVPLSSAPPLIIPKELDHRYFVSNAPHCFSESMFDKGGCF